MKIYIELYASLMPLLPPGTERFRREMTVDDSTTVQQLIDQLRIPPEQAHLVLLNGSFVNPGDRAARQLEENATLSVWPPVAGG
jgi:molybdopterin synthase sulfur carrier subunit